LVGVPVEVAEGGNEVFVGTIVGASVGETGVLVKVEVGGTGVLLGVAVGGT